MPIYKKIRLIEISLFYLKIIWKIITKEINQPINKSF